MAELRPFEDVVGEVKTSESLLVRGFIGRTGINPSVRESTDVGKALTAYQRQLIATEELTNTGIASALDVQAKRFTGVVDATMQIEKAGGIVPGTGKRWEDVFSRPQDFTLSPSMRAYADAMASVIDEVEPMRTAYGLESRAATLSAGTRYIPRQVKEIRGVEIRRASRAAKPRFYAEATEGVQKGVSYSDNPRENLRLYVSQAYREIAAAQLEQAVTARSITPKQLVGVVNPGAITQFDAAQSSLRTATQQALRTTRAFRKYQTEQMSVLMKGKPFGSVDMAALQAQIRGSKAGQRLVGERTQALAGLNQAKFARIRAREQLARAVDSARSAEAAPGSVFDEQGTIAIGHWRNRIFRREEADALVKAISPGEQKTNVAMRAFELTANYSRFLGAVGDFAAPFIQGLPTLARNPVVWARSSAIHYYAFLDPTVQARFMREHLATVQEMAQHATAVGDQEFFAALQEGGGLAARGIAERLPGGARVADVATSVGRQTFGRFQSSYNMFLTMDRTLLWEALRPQYVDNMEGLAQYVRNMTGGLNSRALGVTRAQQGVEGMWLAFSPRLLRSTLALTKEALNPMTQVGRESARTMLQLAAAVTGIYVAAGIGMGRSREEITQGLNPLNGKKFLSYQVNGDWIGVGGQIRSILQTAAKVVADPTSLGSANARDNPMLAFVVGRSAPGQRLARIAVEGLSGGEIDALPFGIVDNPTSMIREVGTGALPFALQGKLDGEGALTTVASLAGARTSAETGREIAAWYEQGKTLPKKDESLRTLLTAYHQAGEGLLSDEGRQAWAEYEPLPEAERKLYRQQHRAVSTEMHQIESYRTVRRKQLASAFPELDAALVEEAWNAKPQRSYTPRTPQGRQRLAELRGQQPTSQPTRPSIQVLPSPAPSAPLRRSSVPQSAFPQRGLTPQGGIRNVSMDELRQLIGVGR